MQAEVPEPLDHACAQGGAVLADARREHDRVEAAQLGEIRADVVPDAVGPDGEAGLGERISPGGSVRHVAHVAVTGEAEDARALVEQRVELVDAQAGHAVQVHEHRGVEVARACAHDEALQRGEAHRGVDRAPAVDRGGRGAVAQVQHDELELVERAPEQLGRAARHELVARAVEAVLAHAVPLGHRAVDRVGEGLGGHRLVERGVEDGHVRHRVQHGERGANARKVRRIVQGGELAHRLDA